MTARNLDVAAVARTPEHTRATWKLAVLIGTVEGATQDPTTPKALSEITGLVADKIDLHVEVLEAEAPNIPPLPLELALRMLAQMMVRSYQEGGQSKLNEPPKDAPSSLTLLPTPIPHCDDETA